MLVMKNGTVSFEDAFAECYKTKYTLNIRSINHAPYVHTKIGTCMFIAALFVIA